MRGLRQNHSITVDLTVQLLLQGLHEKLTQPMAVASAVWQTPVVNDTYGPYTYFTPYTKFSDIALNQWISKPGLKPGWVNPVTFSDSCKLLS